METGIRENADRCVCCGAVVPEGQLICKQCQLAEPMDRNRRRKVFSRLDWRKKPKPGEQISTK